MGQYAFSALERRLATLLEQQMWCWGCDVRREAGNLLLAYGAHKRPSPVPRLHSAYTYPLLDGAALTLWGWGVWVACEGYGSVFLSRARGCVRTSALADLAPQAWRAQDLPPTQRQHTPAHEALLVQALGWISTYEAWILACCGTDYREATLTCWQQRRKYAAVPSEAMSAAWAELAQHITRQE